MDEGKPFSAFVVPAGPVPGLVARLTIVHIISRARWRLAQSAAEVGVDEDATLRRFQPAPCEGPSLYRSQFRTLVCTRWLVFSLA